MVDRKVKWTEGADGGEKVGGDRLEGRWELVCRGERDGLEEEGEGDAVDLGLCRGREDDEVGREGGERELVDPVEEEGVCLGGQMVHVGGEESVALNSLGKAFHS